MTIKAATAAVLLAAASTSAMAQGITGGELGIEYNVPTDGSDLGGTTYSGGIEYGFLQTFSVSGNAAGYKLDGVSTTASNVTLHGSYHLSSSASVGAFYARDSVDGGDANIYGVEGGTEFMGGDVGGYIAKADGEDGDGTLFGVEGSYGLPSGFSVIGEADLFRIDDVTLSQVAIGGEYQMQAGPEFYAQIGRITGDVGTDSDSVGFIGIGARVAFGSSRGTTFTNRSIFEVLPGF